MKITAAQIIAALWKRFERDHICFSEVGTGSFWKPMGKKYRRIDFLAIKKTWSPITVVVVEVKTAHADFLNDEKWPEYMERGHRFYWACPKGLIAKDEIDPKAGLIHFNPDGGKVRTVKKAIYQDKELDAMMLLGLLLWRTGGNAETPVDREENIRRIMHETTVNQEIGKIYTGFVAKKLNEAQETMRELKNETADKLREYTAVKEWMDDNGLSRQLDAIDLLRKTKPIADLLLEMQVNSHWQIADIVRQAKMINVTSQFKTMLPHVIQVLKGLQGVYEKPKTDKGLFDG